MDLRRLDKQIQHGRLDLHLAGDVYQFGHGQPQARWIIPERRTLVRIARDPEWELGETYLDGRWDAGPGGPLHLLQVLMANFPTSGRREHGRFLKPLRRLAQQWNRVRRSYRNVARHYDLDEWLFRQFLDRDLQYSCAYFFTPDASLEEAQRAKCHHLMTKLRLDPGQRVLDIGSGWGGLALFLAEHGDVEVTGLTLSREQLRVAQDRARRRGLETRVRFLLEDYREHSGRYERVVSVGMFEHVGVPYHRRFFKRITELLEPDGVAVVHTIGRSGPSGSTNPWIRRHIFPGGYIPALSELSRSIEPSALRLCDVEVLRLHYALTLEAWLERFETHRAEVAERLGERFCRMWEFYLAACAASFRWRDLVVFQVQLSQQLSAVPLTRDYLYRPAEQSATHALRRVHP
ncbi:MAG: SAM-dependent methyltransferase [Chromatiales bacterium 21-64-14]|nr:MAG: SAM-dependent methyltransferase [Chromatiales bacterium 21-64-14]HQU16583.1 cyclopropane-fatty-acyl-phospholipid synthase family protein [Gammaproteobacteria bacterium]